MFTSWIGGSTLPLAVAPSAALPLASLTLSVAGGTPLPCNSGDGPGPPQVLAGQALAFAPPVPVADAGDLGDLRLTDAAGATQGTSVTIVAPLWGSYTFGLRSDLPVTWATGPRSIAQLPLPATDGMTRFEAVTSSLAEGLNLLAGIPLSRVTATSTVGDASLSVERTAGMVSRGTIEVDGVTYTYTSLDPTGALGGLSVQRGGQTVAGVQAVHLAGTQVAYTTGSTSDVSTLKDGFFLDTATGPDLTALGRNLGVLHSPAIASDDQYRAIIKSIAYGPKTSLYGIELALDAILGPGSYTLAEDPIGAPCQVQISVPYASIADISGIGCTYVDDLLPVAPASEGTLPVAAPVLGLGSVFDAADASTAQPWADLALLSGTDAATSTAGTLALGAQTVPAPTITVSFATLPTDLGACVDLLSGAEPGRFQVAAVTGPSTYAVHQGQFEGVSLATTSQGNLVTIVLPPASTAEADGPFSYPRDVGRQVCIWASAGGNQGVRNILTVLDAGTGVDLSTYQTPLARRSVTCVVDGSPFVAETAASVTILPVFPAASGLTYRMPGAYTETLSGDTVSLSRRVALASPPASYLVQASDVLSAQATSDITEDVTASTATPPVLSQYPLYIDAPFAALEAYLSDLTAAGVWPVLTFT